MKRFLLAGLLSLLCVAASADQAGPGIPLLQGGNLKAGTVLDAALGTRIKPSVNVAAIANLTLSGAQTVDGVAGTAGVTQVLATAQSTASQNGPWVMQSGAWTRPLWYPSGGTTQARLNSTIQITSGNTYQGSTWLLVTSGAITIDTTATTWTDVLFNLFNVTGFLTWSNITTPVPCADLPALTGAVTSSACATTLTAVPLSGLAAQATDTIVANVTGGSAAPTAASVTAVANILPVATAAQQGVAKVDNATITAPAGVLTCATATSVQIGCGRPDNSSITELAGVWSAVNGAAGVSVPTISGNWYPSGSWLNMVGSTVNTAGINSGTLFFVPFYLTANATFTHIGILAGTISGSPTVVLGIYASSGGQPTGAPITNSNSTSLSLTTNTFSSYAFGTPVTLGTGLYFLAYSVSGLAPNLVGENVPPITGFGFPTTPTASNLVTPTVGFSQSFSYSATLPSVGSLSQFNSSGVPAFVFLQAQ